MAASRSLLKHTLSSSPLVKSFLSQTLRFCSSSSSPSHHHDQEYTKRYTFKESWEFPKDSKAEATLASVYEMELQMQEKQRKDKAKKKTMLSKKKERKKAKAELAKAHEEERRVCEEEFRQTLIKERAEKLENWLLKEQMRVKKNKENSENLRRQSSMWINENVLEKKIL